MFRPVKLRQYLRLMTEKGYPVEAVLAGSGISNDALNDSFLLLDIPRYKIITSNIVSLTGDQGIGLEFGSKTELKDLGMLGFLVMSAQTIRQTAHYWSNYSHELVGILVRLKLVEVASSGAWTLEFSEITPLGRVLNFCIEEQLVMICELARKLASVQSTIARVELSYPPPPHHAIYEDYFDAPIKFSAPKTRITILNPTIDHPLIGNDAEFHEICSRQCELMMRKIHEKDSIASRTKHALMRFKGHSPGIEIMACEFNVSPRTLRRHLAEEGYTYQELVDEFRAELAQEYLRSGSITPKEVSYLLGFNHPTSFHRAFKRWTGSSINEFRGSLK